MSSFQNIKPRKLLTLECYFKKLVKCKICKTKYPFKKSGLVGTLLFFAVITPAIVSIIASSYYIVEENGIYRKTWFNLFLNFGLPFLIYIFGINVSGKVLKKYVDINSDQP